MNNSLIVGINGTIGGALFSHLQVSSTVWGTTHKSETLQPENVFYLNLLDEPSCWHFSNNSFDTVYLCAGICRMALCEEDPVTTFKVNVTGMWELIKRLANTGSFIVYLSTNQVFSGDNPFESPTANQQPLNEYGRQKAMIENLIKTNLKHFAVVRLTKVIEQNMSLVKNWIDCLLQNRIIQAFHDMPLAPVSLRQVVATLVTIGQKQQPGYYHISGAKDVSYYEIAGYLAERLGRRSDLVQAVSAFDSGIKKIFLPRFTTLDCSSTIALGGKEPPLFSDVLNECFNFPNGSN